MKLGERTAQIDLWSVRHNQASQFLITCLEDVKEKIVTLERPASDGDGGRSNVFPSPTASPFHGGIPEPPLPDVAVLPGRLEDLSAEQRERVLSHLLERLHTFTKSQQLEAATAVGSGGGGLLRSSLLPASGKEVSAASRRSGGLGNGVSLPRIPALPRRSAASTLPISQSVVSAAQEAASTSLMGMALAASSGLGRSRGGFGASASASAGGLHPVQESSTEYEMGAGEAGGGGLEAMPQVDDLLSRVMSDVRPWGKRSQELGLTASRQGVFLRRGVK